jgi:hypothetical protein
MKKSKLSKSVLKKSAEAIRAGINPLRPGLVGGPKL